MSFSPNLVSNNILQRAFRDGVSVSPMKLQKLLYFAASEYGKQHPNDALLGEAFQVWRYGPVVRSVYDEFKSFGGGPIKAYAKNAEGKAFMVSEQGYPDLSAAIDRVWQQASGLSAVELSRITHLPGSAWSNANDKGHGYLSDADVAADTTYRQPLHLG